MDQNVYQMKTDEVKTGKIIVECKTDIGNRAVGFRALASSPGKIFQTEGRYPDMGIIPDIADVVKYKRRGQGISINQDNNNSQQR